VGIEALCASLEDSARKRAEGRLLEAHREAARLRHTAERAAARRLAASLEREDGELRRAARDEIAAARREARQRVLSSRDDLIERIFALAIEMLPELLASPAYRDSLHDQLRRALAHVPGAARVRATPSLAEALEALLPDAADLQLAPDPEMPPGFQVCSSDGRLVVDATLTTRLAVERPRLSAELVARLGAGSG
jgi:vacuolar-type H+-ATPase subunit E/Vma4